MSDLVQSVKLPWFMEQGLGDPENPKHQERFAKTIHPDDVFEGFCAHKTTANQPLCYFFPTFPDPFGMFFSGFKKIHIDPTHLT
jgi:hypothetical protein